MDYQHQVEHDLHPFGDTTHVLGPQSLAQRMQYYSVPGVSLAVIHAGALAWTASYGTQGHECTTPITPATRFAAASLSKPVVAMAVLQLVQEGVLDLDADVNHYLQSWKVPESPYSTDRNVTLRRLLSNSAGMTTYGFWGYHPTASIPTLVQVLDGQPPANSVPVRVDTIPGSRWRYSSGGYVVVQQLLMDVLQQPFPAIMDDLVLTPLGMQHSAFYPAPPPDVESSSAWGHDATGVTLPGRWRVHPELGSAGLWSTATDLAKLLVDVHQSQHGQSNRVLSAAMANQMLTIHSSNWALGYAIDGDGSATRFAHGGAALGFRCSMVAYRQHGSGAVVMTNGDRGDHLCIELLHSIARSYQWPDYYHYQDALV